MLRAVVEEGLALQAAADEGRALHAAMERGLARQAAAERGAAAAPATEAACRPARAPQCAAAPAGMAAGPCLAAPAAPAGAAIAAALPLPQLDCASPRGALEGPPPAGTSAHALRAALASAAPPLTGEPVRRHPAPQLADGRVSPDRPPLLSFWRGSCSETMSIGSETITTG